MLLCFIICLIYRRRLHETPDLQASFLPFESLKLEGFFTEQSDDKGMRVKLTIYRIAFLWIVALIIVAQGGRGAAGGWRQRMVMPPALHLRLHRRSLRHSTPTGLTERCQRLSLKHFSNLRVDVSKDSDDDSESLTRTPEPFSVYSHLWLATIFVSPLGGGGGGAAVHL